MYTYYNYKYSISIFYLLTQAHTIFFIGGALIFSNQFQTYFEESKDVKKLTESEDFWKIGRQNVYETVARARFHINIAKKKLRGSERRRICVVESPIIPALRERWSIQRGAPAIRACKRLWQNALARLRAAKHEWCYETPGKRDCSWRVLNAL